jgi:hypothetical protein
MLLSTVRFCPQDRLVFITGAQDASSDAYEFESGSSSMLSEVCGCCQSEAKQADGTYCMA